MPHRRNKLISLTLCLLLLLEQTGFAQTVSLNLSNYLSQAPKPAVSDTFRPLHLRYLSYDSQSNDFKLLLDKGDFFNQETPKLSNSSTPELEEATQELLKYFFIGLSLPNDKFWVNLRPDSPDDILDPDLEKTDIGRIFLEADVQLKQDTAGLTSPQTKEGKEYWDKLYKKAGELFGSENITIPTLTRPWIVPDEVILRESPEGAYIYKATLKVMLEGDYLKNSTNSINSNNSTNYSFNDPRLKELNQYSTQLIKESIIPKLTQAVNTSKRYAPLRQVYYSLILAQWFKQSHQVTRSQSHQLPENPYIKLIDSGKLITPNFSLLAQQPYDKQTYFEQYQKSFQDGEYNLQEPVYTPMGQSIRRYMSGGLGLSRIPDAVTAIKSAGNPLPYFSSFRKKFLSLLMAATLAIPSVVSIPSVSDGGLKIEKKEKKVELNIKVVEELISVIRKNGGKITFADYMSLCLYGPGGYYSGGVVNIGDGGGMNEKDDGDFGTFPEISPHAFGYSLAEKIHKMWKDMGNPSGFQIVEMGAGNGTMAKMILEYIQKKYPEFMSKLTYTIIEISPELIERQKKVMQDTGYPVKWVLGSAINMQLKKVVGVIISNELPDAFPVRLVREDSSGKLKEVFVTYQDGKFVEVLGDVSDSRIYEYIKMLEKEVPDKNTLHGLLSRNFPINLNMLSWQEAISRSLKTGYVITIDYGFMGIPTEASGLRVYGNDNFDPVDLARDPEKFIYGFPGAVDITTDTIFSILKRYGKNKGLIPAQLISQGEFFKLFKEYMGEHDSDYWKYSSEFHPLIYQSGEFVFFIQGKEAPALSGSSPMQDSPAISFDKARFSSAPIEVKDMKEIVFNEVKYKINKIGPLAESVESGEFSGKNKIFKLSLTNLETNEEKTILLKQVKAQDAKNDIIATRVCRMLGIKTYHVEIYEERKSLNSGGEVWELIEFLPSQLIAWTDLWGRLQVFGLEDILSGEEEMVKKNMRELGAVFAVEFLLDARDAKMKHILRDSQSKALFRIDWEFLLDFEPKEKHKTPSLLKDDEKKFLELLLKRENGAELIRHIHDGFDDILIKAQQDIAKNEESQILREIKRNVAPEKYDLIKEKIITRVAGKSSYDIMTRLGIGLEFIKAENRYGFKKFSLGIEKKQEEVRDISDEIMSKIGSLEWDKEGGLGNLLDKSSWAFLIKNIFIKKKMNMAGIVAESLRETRMDLHRFVVDVFLGYISRAKMEARDLTNEEVDELIIKWGLTVDSLKQAVDTLGKLLKNYPDIAERKASRQKFSNIHNELLTQIEKFEALAKEVRVMFVSSSLISDFSNPKGGIDLSRINKSMRTENVSSLGSGGLNSAVDMDFDLNEELTQLQKLLNAEIIPSADRLDRYARAACSSFLSSPESKDNALSLVVETFRLQEEKSVSAPAELKALAAWLEQTG